MKFLPTAYQKQWGVNYSINDRRRDFMSDNKKKPDTKAAENAAVQEKKVQAQETQAEEPYA